MCVEYKKKPTPGKCNVRWCTNDARPRKGGKFGKMCYKHETRRRKEVDPVAYTYYKRQQTAKKRGISFDITLVEFRQFCDETNYIQLMGNRAGDATIDRIRNSEGYHLGNIQVLTRSHNSKKWTFSVPF